MRFRCRSRRARSAGLRCDVTVSLDEATGFDRTILYGQSHGKMFPRSALDRNGRRAVAGRDQAPIDPEFEAGDFSHAAGRR